MKFQRQFSMHVDGNTTPWNFGSPLTLRFDVEKKIFSSMGTARLAVYNLRSSAVRDIYFDRSVSDKYLGVVLNAGYHSQLPLPQIFRGNIRAAWTERRGPNLVTMMECFDGGFGVANSTVSIAKPAGWSFSETVKEALATMAPRVRVGAIGDPPYPNSRGMALNGSTWSELQKLVPPGSELFIDGEVANLLQQNDVVATSLGIPVVQSSTGLVGIPRKQDAVVYCTLIFEPRLVLGQLVALNSLLNPRVNGPYRVQGIHHYGTISDTEAGVAYTDLALFAGTLGGTFNDVVPLISPQTAATA